jgi:hypothetical protein
LKTILLLLVVFSSLHLRAESQNNDYKGITDPFGDPANYEFAEDEKEDKEFFHLGRFLMLGMDIGAGLFTGGLAGSIDPGLFFGGHLLYFLDRSLAFEASGHFSKHIDAIRPANGGYIDIDTLLVPITGGFRYYFDTRDAPKALAIANPYLAFGAGVYIRTQTITDIDPSIRISVPDSATTNFGLYGGAGMEFSIYRRHIYLGGDIRYHLIFFNDESETYNGLLQPGDRSGDYIQASMSITYNF